MVDSTQSTCVQSFFLTSEQFRFDFSASDGTIHICAFQTTDYQEFTHVHTAGCAQNVVVSRGPGTVKEANKLKLELKTLENTAELLGFSSFIPPDLWPGTARREFTGKVTLPGAAAGTRYLVAFAKNPILETTADEVGNPSAFCTTRRIIWHCLPLRTKCSATCMRAGFTSKGSRYQQTGVPESARMHTDYATCWWLTCRQPGSYVGSAKAIQDDRPRTATLQLSIALFRRLERETKLSR